MDEHDEDFRAFVLARWVALVRFAYLLTGDTGHAEDIVQTVLERVWRRWPRVRIDSPEAYVRTAIARQVVSRHRWLGRRVQEQPLAAEPTAVPGSGGATGRGVTGWGVTGRMPDGTDDRALRELLWAEVRRLPPRMRAVVVLRVWEGLSEAETARVLGCSPGSVKSQLSRGLARLRASGPLQEEAAERAFGTQLDAVSIRGEA